MYSIIGGDQKEYGPVTAEEIRQWITQGRANGRTLAKADAGPWKPLASFPEFADALGAAPAAAPPPIGAPVPSGTSPSANPRQTVHAPAVFLIVAGALNVALGVVSLLSRLVGWTLPHPQPTGNPGLDRFLELLSGGLGSVFDLVAIGISTFIIFGGYRMMKLSNHGLCVAASIVALVPCLSPCCCLGLPAGIWALVVLCKPEVKSAFESAAP